jgi:hypothetical protein
MSVIPGFRILRQEDYEFEASLSYIARSSLKNKEVRGWGKMID